MSQLLAWCPHPPDWTLDWAALESRYEWLGPLAECLQDPENHGEGDVGTHTRMVCEELAALPGWRALEEEARQVLFLAALFHDIAKPLCRQVDAEGTIRFPGHSRRGAILARRILWRLGVPFRLREQVTALVRHHLKPFHLLDRTDGQRVALEISQTVRCDRLALLAEADARGRLCRDQARLLDQIALFVEFCREQRCLEHPYRFATDHARFVYFQREGATPEHVPHEHFGSEVILLSGLPGAGKDYWARTTLPDVPQISLDEVREELGVEPTDEQGGVLQQARLRAREHLRRKERFVWNATNLSRLVRRECIRLCAAYEARIRIVYLEVEEAELHRRNQQRPRPVPRRVMERMLERWEVPDRTEAHEVLPLPT